MDHVLPGHNRGAIPVAASELISPTKFSSASTICDGWTGRTAGSATFAINVSRSSLATTRYRTPDNKPKETMMMGLNDFLLELIEINLSARLNTSN